MHPCMHRHRPVFMCRDDGTLQSNLALHHIALNSVGLRSCIQNEHVAVGGLAGLVTLPTGLRWAMIGAMLHDISLPTNKSAPPLHTTTAITTTAKYSSSPELSLWIYIVRACRLGIVDHPYITNGVTDSFRREHRPLVSLQGGFVQQIIMLFEQLIICKNAQMNN